MNQASDNPQEVPDRERAQERPRDKIPTHKFVPQASSQLYTELIYRMHHIDFGRLLNINPTTKKRLWEGPGGGGISARDSKVSSGFPGKMKECFMPRHRGKYKMQLIIGTDSS